MNTLQVHDFSLVKLYISFIIYPSKNYRDIDMGVKLLEFHYFLYDLPVRI